MATQWGRKETIIWPPHVPILSYTAVASAVLCTCLFIWQRLAFTMTPLQKSYITEYIRSGIGGTFEAHQSYQLIYLEGRNTRPRLAAPVDFVDGKTTLPNGKVVPVALSESATKRRLWMVLSWAETKASRHFAAPLAPAGGVRRRRLVGALWHQPD